LQLLLLLKKLWLNNITKSKKERFFNRSFFSKAY